MHFVIFNTVAVLLLNYWWQPATTYCIRKKKKSECQSVISLIDGWENIIHIAYKIYKLKYQIISDLN